MKIEQAILTILVFLLLIGVSGCVNTPVDSRFEEFMLGLLSTDINVKGCQADSLFEYKYTFPKDENYHAVFLTNATCSFCIGTALSCFHSYCQSQVDADLIFLLQGDNIETFKYYYEKDPFRKSKRALRVRIQQLDYLQDLPTGLYLITNGKVSSYMIWEDL